MPALSFYFDANVRLVQEPGYVQHFSNAELARRGQSADDASEKQLWFDPAYGTVMLKPLQLQPDFLNHAAQLTSGACLRLATDFITNAADVVGGLIWEANVGTASNPWIFHTPATSALGAPTLAPAGLNGSYTLQSIVNASESGSGAVFASPPGSRVPESDVHLGGTDPQALRLLLESNHRFSANQGFLFRWFVPDPRLAAHQTIYAFTFGQYLLLCRDQLVEVFRDVSAAGDKSSWNKSYAASLFTPGGDVKAAFSPDWPFGQQSPSNPNGGERSLMVIPYRRQRVLVIANTGKFFTMTTRAHPQLLPDGSDYDITRADIVGVWALTATVGRFQIQKVLYEGGPATLEVPHIVTEYTPVSPPAVIFKVDSFHSESATATLQNPALYTFPTSPTSDDCPPPTADGSGQTRTYGITITLGSSPDQNFTPQFYGIDIIAQPQFMDNPSAATAVFDQVGASRIASADISLGSLPGDGRMTAHVIDVPSYPLKNYYNRSEMPVQLFVDSTPVFTGYSDRLEYRPLRADAGIIHELTVRAVDRWLLLEQSFLRDQRDYTGVGHITTVDNIAMQCGIDTVGQPAEYPTGWNSTMASVYDTPLGTPIQTSENLEGNQLLGWKPQPRETGAVFLKRIQDFFSGWLMGFRLDGTFYYLPYNYFTSPSQVFHAEHGGVNSGLVQSAGAGLSVSVTGGSAQVGGSSVTVGGGGITIGGLTDNAVNSLYLNSSGVGSANTTGIPPAGTVGLGTATTSGGAVTAVDTGANSGRQLSTDAVFRNPVEFRTIEPSGNVVQVVSQYMIDLTPNKSGLFVDWASVFNPAAPNYLGRYKWNVVEIGGAFSCAQLNAMAYIVFQSSRRRRRRVSFDADFVPALKIGQVFTLEGYGNWRLLEFRGTFLKGNWHACNYTGESTEAGY